MLMASDMRLYFIILSLAVVEDREGDAFTYKSRHSLISTLHAIHMQRRGGHIEGCTNHHQINGHKTILMYEISNYSKATLIL